MLGARAIVRGVRAHRPSITLGVIVTLSLISMASGTRASVLGDAVREAVSLAAYPFLVTMNAIQDGAGYATGIVVNYDAAQREVDELNDELIRLRLDLARAAELELENVRLRNTLQFVESNPGLTLIPASILQRSKGMLTINVGALQGVKPSMCAITKDGVVGIVTEVELTVSYIAALHHEHCRIEARIGQGRMWGVVQGSGNDINQICRAQYINLQDHVLPGDEVVSAGGNIYPAELPIGRVLRVREQGDFYQAADVMPYADPYRIEEVLLVRAALPEPSAMAAAADTDLPYSMPDDRSLQERFAP